jgi:hypothetical protein
MNFLQPRWAIALIAAFTALVTNGIGRAQTPASEIQAGITVLERHGGFAAGTKCVSDQCINVGDKATFSLTAYCYIGGVPVTENVTLSLSGIANETGWSYTFVPNPVQTTQISILTITTTTSAKPDNAQLSISGTGPLCGFYDPAVATLTVKPKIVGAVDKLGNATTDVWWFNQAKPENYSTKITANAIPASTAYGPFEWKIVDDGGRNFARFEGDAVTISTPDQMVKVKGFRNSTTSVYADKDKGLFNLKVKVNNIESDPFPLTSLEPWKLKYKTSVDNPQQGVGATGYDSLIQFELIDQYGDVLPQTLPLTELFDPGPGECVWPGGCTDWDRGGVSQKTNPNANPSLITDEISKTCLYNVLNPTCGHNPIYLSPPGCKGSLCTVPVFKWKGGVWVGGDATNVKSGVQVEKQTWDLFQDHGRDCKIQSPIDGSLVSPFTCP